MEWPVGAERGNDGWRHITRLLQPGRNPLLKPLERGHFFVCFVIDVLVDKTMQGQGRGKWQTFCVHLFRRRLFRHRLFQHGAP